jgi:hypothetical protein
LQCFFGYGQKPHHIMRLFLMYGGAILAQALCLSPPLCYESLWQSRLKY